MFNLIPKDMPPLQSLKSFEIKIPIKIGSCLQAPWIEEFIAVAQLKVQNK